MAVRHKRSLLGPIWGVLVGCSAVGCSVEAGQDFQVAEAVFDEGYFYCAVEPMLFAQGCGSGDAARGEDGRGCHFSVTAFRLTDYSPLVGSDCSGNTPNGGPSAEARSNYSSAQLFMDRDPDRAPLLQRPTHTIAHPRVVIPLDSTEADLIREWATRFSSR